MENTQVFYYKFKPNYFWMALNLIFLALIIHCATQYPACLYWWQGQVLVGVFIYSFLLWLYKYACKHIMATITDDYIKIDFTSPLSWKDIDYAEYKTAKCGFMRRPIIALKAKDNIDYPYNFLQKHNGEFTPFSIPLYILSKEDIEKITDIIKRKVEFKK